MEQATEDVDGVDNLLRHSKCRRHRQQTQTRRATEGADGADNSPRHSKYRQSRRGIDNRRGRSKSQETQIEHTTHQGIADADEADEV